jgi:hypothetical protein
MAKEHGHHSLTRAIADHLAEWDSPHVELAIYGHRAPDVIAIAIEQFCCRELGAAVARPLFYRSSIGAVAGLELDDGRRVVVKAHQPNRSRSQLEQIVILQQHLASQRLLAPAVLAGPSPLGCGFAIAEAFDDRGVTRDAHQPEVRLAMARSLNAVVSALESFVESSLLDPPLLAVHAAGPLWPKPHSRLFDFGATRVGAEDIDHLAALARAQMVAEGRIVLGHGDWRAEHVRFEGPDPVVAFDWDSLCKEAEPALVGFTAHAFCSDWTDPDAVQAPTLEEARDFVRDYELARSASFSFGERTLCAAAFAYSVAYTARCAHALGKDERRQRGTFQHLLSTEGPRLLEL